MRNSRQKIQHYVPRFYLQNFSIARRENQVFCFDKIKRHCFIVSIKNIACENHFYDITADGDQKFEGTLSNLESYFADVCSKIITNSNLTTLSYVERIYLAGFVATQSVRTREERLSIQRHLERLESWEWFQRKVGEQSPEDLTTSVHLETFGQLRLLIGYIERMKWALTLNRTEVPYWSSDNPVFSRTSLDVHLLPRAHWRQKTVQIPLSPKFSLLMCNSKQSESVKSSYEVTNPERIEFQNSLQVYGASRYLFSNENNFAMAERILQEIQR